MKTLLSAVFAASLMVYGEGNNNETVSNMQTITHPVKHITVSINKPARDVYQFASNPENFPKWVKFVKSIRREGDIWVAESSLGTIKIKFTPQNEFGVIDHRVTLANGNTVYNPMRILENDKGCEFIFTLFRLPGRSDQEFNEDAQAVTNDLHQLKEIMEH
jgi:hypothetical protein